MTRRLAPADVALLAELVGLRFPTEDLAPLTEALDAYLAFVAPLLQADLDDVNPSLTHDPRWRD
jgi:Asp-tRNA(Asn)/Glu-tRNA(Gln) amidotransferase C subunit